MRIYLVRHGEAEDDIEDCYGGIADFPLTQRGREQAAVIADQLAGEGIAGIYSSPLARARETAEIIAERLQRPLEVVDDLQERNSYGVLSGINKDRAKQVFARVLAGLKEKPGYSREYIIGAEEWDDFVHRVRRALRRVERHAVADARERIAIVTHGKFSQALLRDVLEIDGEVDLKLSALNVLDYQPTVAKLVKE